MAVYTGVKCISCGNAFKEGDDIVVCPDCGTPYHRACYQKEGTCINTELHEKGASFTTGHNPDDIRCPRCGAQNAPLTLFCKSCGMPLSSEETKAAEPDAMQLDNSGFFSDPLNMQAFRINFSDPLCGLNPEETFEDVKVTDLAQFVGTNTFYFLPMFKRMKDTGHRLTWNFSAMLVPSYYFAYRKMYLYMVIAFFLEFFIALPTFIAYFSTGVFANAFPVISDFAAQFDLNSQSFQMAANITYFLSYVLRFVGGAYANWLYYRHALRKIKKIRQTAKNPAEKIKSSGNVSKLAVILVVGVPFLLAIGAVMVTSFTTVMNFVTKNI